jgi:hypothetical protein
MNMYSMQKKIINAVQGTSNLFTCLKAFSFRGRKGNHQVLVFTVARVSAAFHRSRSQWLTAWLLNAYTTPKLCTR